MQYLRQSTASQSVLIGPFVDSTDGVTAETGLTIANTDIRLSANGGNMAAKNSGGGTHDEAGWYSITLDATDTATVGRLQLSVAVSGALPVFAEFQVLEEAIYDALFASGATAPATASALATAQADLDTLTGSDGATLSTAAIAAVNATVDTALSDYDAPTNAEMTAAFTEIKGATWATTDTLEAIRDRGDSAWITATGFPSASAIADAVWDEPGADHLITGTTGEAQYFTDFNVSALPNASANAAAVWATTLPGSYTGSQAGKILADVLTDTGTTIPGTITTLQGNVTSILADTNELQTDWANGGRLDLLVDAILEDTGTTIPATLTTIDGIVDAILVDTAEIGAAGAGLTAVPWNAAWDAEVQSEVKDALDATVDDTVPTDGTRPSVSAGIYMLCQYLFDTSISGTTMTVRKPDGSTTLFTITLDDGTTPTSKTRAS